MTKYQPQDIFSTIGGLMGVFLGISLISVLELFDFLFAVVTASINVIRCKLNGSFETYMYARVYKTLLWYRQM